MPSPGRTLACYYEGESKPLTDIANKAFEMLWAYISGQKPAPDDLSTLISEIKAEDNDDVNDGDLLTAFGTVRYGLKCIIDPLSPMGAQYAGDFGMGTAAYAELEQEYAGELEEIEWQRNLLNAITARGNLPARRTDFEQWLARPPTWLSSTIRA